MDRRLRRRWPIKVTPAFWQELASGQTASERWLLGAGHSTADSPNWDMHPSGDCITILLKGAIDVVLQRDDGDEIVELRKRADAVVAPRGVWHRQIVRQPSERVFLVAGEGTEQRPV